MRHLLILLSVLMVACGSSPVSPTPEQPPVVAEPRATLSLVVMGTLSERPLANVEVRLLRPGLPPNPFDVKRTDFNGRASWVVTVPSAYTVVAIGHTITDDVREDAGWLLSVPQ